MYLKKGLVHFQYSKMKYIFKYLVLIFSLNFIGQLESKDEKSFRCDYKYSKAAKGWFKHVVIPATWFDARLRCQMEGAMLASPTTPVMKNEMMNIIKNYAIQAEIFTGMSATISKGDFISIEGTSFYKMDLNWAHNEPNNKDNNEECIAFNGCGEVLDKPCGIPRPYICYSPTCDCPEDPGYILDPKSKHSYKFHEVPRDFSRANLVCTAEGGHLAVIDNKTEYDFVMGLYPKYPSKPITGLNKDVAFIGVHTTREETDWRSIHGPKLTATEYNKFDQKMYKPSEECATLNRSGVINEYDCEKLSMFICEKYPDTPKLCQST